ncbi:MAG: peptidoglycan D,D-transpeptidase FtsI family protein [Mycobacteriales bacterium]
MTRPRPRPLRSGRRLRASFLAVCAVLALLGGRLVQLQGFESSAYARMARAQRLRTEALPATRGAILDRGGTPLVYDVDARGVQADPALVTDATAEAAMLAPLLGFPAAQIRHQLTVPGQFSWLAHGLTPAQGDAVIAANQAGVYVVKETKRVYPDGNLAAAVLGFTGADGTGLAGIEYVDNAVLTGEPGRLVEEVDPTGRVIPTGRSFEVAPVPGQSVELTIDRDIQWVAESTLAAQVKATKAKSGMVVVMNPQTGAVLALASVPGFNPADPVVPAGGTTGEPAVASVYEPGSVNKIITASAAIETGVVTPNTVITVPPYLMVDGTAFHDAEPHGTEHLTFTGVLAQSSNIGTIKVAERLGKATLYRFLRMFGLGSVTGVGLPGESAGLLPPPQLWSGTQAATIPFGQGIGVTAMQMAEIYSTVANGGLREQPHVVRGTVDANGVFHHALLPAPVQVIDPTTAATVRTMLQAVTTNGGTAPAAAIPGYLIAGKTGTANAVGANGRYNGGFVASFIGMAPADHPQLVVEVVLNQPQTNIYGGAVAAPVFRQIMGFALQTLRIPPSTSPPPVLRLYG